MQKLRGKKGITIIALVITIIVLLILAGIALSILTGNNGLLNKAVISKKDTEEGEENENVRMTIMQSIAKNKGKLTIEGLQEAFNEIEAEVYKAGNEFVIKLKSNKMYTINSNGNLKDEIEMYEEPTNVFLTQVSNSTYGTEAKPYEIGSIEDLVDFSFKVNGTVVGEDGTLSYSNSWNRFEKKYIKLINNLNFNLELSYKNAKTKEYGDINENGKVEGLLTELTTGTGWKGIGGRYGDSDRYFMGDFNGNEKKISNLYINDTTGNYSYAGLFGYIHSYGGFARVRNLGVTGNINCNAGKAGGIVGLGNKIDKCYFDGKIENIKTGDSYTGGLVGAGARIENSYSRGIVKGKNIVAGCIGGFIGYGNTIVDNCYNESNVSGVSKVGGIGGHLKSCTVTNCYNKGKVEGASTVEAGIIAFMDGGILIENCYNSGEIRGNGCIGGMAAYLQNIGSLTISKCYNTGNIISSGGGNGGILAAMRGSCNNLIIEKCYNTGKIKGTSFCAGIIGDTLQNNNKIINCYNKGEIEASSSITGITFAGNNAKIVSCYNIGTLNTTATTKYGVSNGGVVENCYYIAGKGNETETAVSKGSSELQGLASTLDKTFTIDDENNTITINNTLQNVWKSDTFNKNDGYPVFDW